MLTLETLSATAHATIRGLSLEFEAPTTSDALRWGLILADRAELFALRRAGTLQKDRLAFSTTYCSEPVTGRSSDVEHLREGVVRFASPRLPVAITTEDPLVDIALSEENLDAHARLHRGLLCQGVVRLDLTAQKGDLLGLRNQARYEGDSRCGGNWQSPRAGVIDDEVAAELMRAMAPTGGPDSLPRCLREAATRDYARLANQPMPDIDRLFDQVAAASAHLDAATLGRISAASCWRFILAPPTLATSGYADENAFYSVCQEAGVSSRVARSLWRDALRGALLPFMPTYVKSDDLNDIPEHCLVRTCDTALLEMHFYFRNRCCAHAVIERFGGDVEAIFGRENEEVLYRERYSMLFGCSGSIALEVLRRLKLRGAGRLRRGGRVSHVRGASAVPRRWRFGARRARVERSIDSRPPVGARPVRADVVRGGQRHCHDGADGPGSRYSPVRAETRLRERRHAGGGAFSAPRRPRARTRFCCACCRRRRRSRSTRSASLHRGSATWGRRSITALPRAMSSARRCSWARGRGRAAWSRREAWSALPRELAVRTGRYLAAERSPELRADMSAAIGMVADLNHDRRWRAPDVSVIERAATRGDDAAVQVETMKATFALRLANALPQRWRSRFEAARARVRKETFLATQAAAWGGHASTVRTLLSIQDISEVDDMVVHEAVDSRTATLQYAVFQGHAECVEAVLDGWGGEYGARALRWALARAVVCGHAHVLRHLRERGYSLYTPNDTPELTPLGYAARFGQPEACAALCECPDVARALQENREDNAILSACDGHHSSVLRVLLETARQSSSAHSWDAFEVCPLVACAMSDDIASMEILVEYDYPVNRHRESSINPLCVAATRGFRGMVELLLFHGASAAGEGPLDTALSRCMGTNMIDCASVRHRMAQRILQERPAEVSGSLGMSLIHGVVRNAKLETLIMLLDAGAHVGAVVDNSMVATGGWTPLHYAVYFCVESHMKDADATYGGAKRSNADAVVRLLIERGAPLDTQSRESHSLNPQRVVVGGSTPRDIALACENADVAVAVAAIIDHAVAKRDAARAALLGA